MTLILVVIAWIIGIVAGDRRPADPARLLLLAVALALLTWPSMRSRRIGRRAPQIPLALLLLSVSLLGAWRSVVSQPRTTEASIWRWIGRPARLEAVIAEEPRWTDAAQRLVIDVLAVQEGAARRRAEGRLALVLPAEPALRLDERLLLEGLVAAPPSGRGFDYAAYLRRRGIYAILKRPKLIRSAPPPLSPRGVLIGLKLSAQRSILRLLPEPEAGLLSGILLGMQNSLPPQVYDDFNRTGTSHILVISGWNISITIAAMLWLAARARLRRWPATLLALATVALYVAFVGPSAGVVRAAVMGAIVALADPLYRRSDPWTALACACMVMSGLEPNVLWDLGFQLSVGAVAGLFACGSGLVRRCQSLLRLRALGWAAEPLGATLAAQVFTLPLLLYHFGSLSLVAPLANIVLLPAVPLAMAAGALVVVGGVLLGPLARLLAFLAWLPLAWLTRGAHVFSQLPFAVAQVPPLPGWMILLYYVLVVGALLAWNSRREARIIEVRRAVDG